MYASLHRQSDEVQVYSTSRIRIVETTFWSKEADEREELISPQLQNLRGKPTKLMVCFPTTLA